MNQNLTKPTLTDLYTAHQGKVSDKWTIYLKKYEEIFHPYQASPVRLLEIGIQNGGSLAIWGKFFDSAVALVGNDINTACARLQYDDPRIHVVIGDANTDVVSDSVSAFASCFEIIIDDGSHRSSDILKSFARYFPKLALGGIYVIEDLHCSYWQEFEGGLVDPWSSMSFLKRLADVINHEHWGVPHRRAEVLRSFEARYGIALDEEHLAQIHSIEFLNSMCVIRKRAQAENELGPRVVVGEDAIAEKLLMQSGTLAVPAEQSANNWSVLQPLPEDELIARRAEVAKLHTDVALGNQQLQTQAERIQALQNSLNQANARLDEIFQSTTWRVTTPVRWGGRQLWRIRRTARLISALSLRVGGFGSLIRVGLSSLRRHGLGSMRAKLRALEAKVIGEAAGETIANSGDPYEDIARKIFTRQQAELTKENASGRIENFAYRPLISVIMPVYKTPVQWLRRAVESLQMQYYDHWELCAVDDCSPGSEQRELLREMAAADTRIRVKVMELNGGISTASNAALEMARGDFIALIDHDDEITPDAFFRIIKAINEHPDVDFLYSDECKIDGSPDKRLFHFIFKPQWSPELMFNGMLTGHLTVYRKALVERVGGFRSEYDFSQDYDLALRMAEAAHRIVHVERVLYLWRSIPGSAASGGKDFARASNLAALNDSLHRRGIPGQAIPLPYANRVKVALPDQPPQVSIIVPSDSADNLRKVISSLKEWTDYPNYELILVCNSPLAERLKKEFNEWGALHFVHYDKKYNFSDKCNEGAKAASGDILIFYNDDVFPLQRDWVECMIEYLWVPGVGGVSPQLLHENGTIQYAGMISGTPGLCGTAYNNVMPAVPTNSFLSMHRYVRNVSILSGACCAVKRELFWSVDGFDAINTPDGHSDMDLSYKLIEAGYRCVYTPHAVLRHIGNHSWGAKRYKYKADRYVLRRWGKQVSTDPFFTASMKSVLYRDFRFPYRIYAEHMAPTKANPSFDVLFVSHELSLTGAPRMLFYAAKAVVEAGGFPVVVSPSDGPMRDEMIRAGIVVIIDASVVENHFLFERFARNFDIAVVNTTALKPVVRQLSAIPILRTLWWLHEAQSLEEILLTTQDIEWSRIQTVCVSEYARSYVPDGISAVVLHNGIPDMKAVIDQPETSSPTRPFTLLIAGTIEPRKAQDVFLQAISLLPNEVRENCRFILTGKLWPAWEAWWARQQDIANLPKIDYLGLLAHDELLNLIRTVDVLVCCSRDEPFSLVVMEAAMLSKPSIMSDHVGSKDIFVEGQECLICEAGSASSLAEQILAAYENREATKLMGLNARKKFERRLTLDVFAKHFLTLVEQEISRSAVDE